MRRLGTSSGVFAALVAMALVAIGLFAIGLFAIGPGAARADEPFDPATKSAIQGVITKQLEAIGHEDGDKAESFAAQGIRQRFPDGPAFMAMVREHYAALLRPKSTTFGAIQPSPHGPLQTMTIVAADGTIWTAIYSLEQDGGTWRITGCGLERVQGQQDI